MSYPQKPEKISAVEVIRRIHKQSDPTEIASAVDAALHAQFMNAVAYQATKKRKVEMTFEQFLTLVTSSRRQRMERAMAAGNFERFMKGRYGYVLTWKSRQAKEAGVMNLQTAAYLNREDSERACQFGPGDTHTEEAKAKIGDARRGKKASDATRAKQAAAKTGKALSDEHREAISAGSRGKPKTEEQKQKMREAAKARWARDRETKMISKPIDLSVKA